jgi:uncharacterized protein YcbX
MMGRPQHAQPRATAAPRGTDRIGRVAELWRYPVKSMRGGTVAELMVTERGGLGDRAWALRDPTSGRIASAKRFPRLLEFRAVYEVEPTFTTRGRVRIEAPGGQTVYADDPEASELISGTLGRRLRLESHAGMDEKTGIDRSTVFGDVSVAQMKPDWTPATMPDYFQLKSGTFFEIGAVYLLASGSVDRLRRLQGGTARIDRRRFRPNLYIDTGDGGAEGDRFVEDEWLGGTMAAGETLVLDDFQPTLWCVTSTLCTGGVTRRPPCAAYRGAAPQRMPGRVRVGPGAGPGAGGRPGVPVLIRRRGAARSRSERLGEDHREEPTGG